VSSKATKATMYARLRPVPGSRNPRRRTFADLLDHRICAKVFFIRDSDRGAQRRWSILTPGWRVGCQVNENRTEGRPSLHNRAMSDAAAAPDPDTVYLTMETCRAAASRRCDASAHWG
jgi:hypothetical protein